jgi:hypothetical protein
MTEIEFPDKRTVSRREIKSIERGSFGRSAAMP